MVEAIQFNRNNWLEVSRFTEKRAGCFVIPNSPSEKCTCCIETKRGTLTATEGDFIIKNFTGEVYPCKPDVFQQTYEAVK